MKRQVIVVGAGPGGSTAAFYLAQKGIDALLLDKETWPRESPCGGSYLPTIYPMLEDMGVLEEMLANSDKPVGRARFILTDEQYGDFTTKGNMRMPRRYGDDCIRRGALNTGVDFMEDFDVTELIMRKGIVKGVKGYYHEQEMSVEADLVIVANGSHSMLSRQLGAFVEDPNMTLYCFRSVVAGVEGMEDDIVEQYFLHDALPNGAHNPLCPIWMSPLRNNVKVLGFTITEKALRDSKLSIEGVLDTWINKTEFGQKRMKNAKVLEKYDYRGSRLPACEKLHKSYYPGAILIGDAISASECAFEYGIPNAMIGGKIAAEVVADIYAANGSFDGETLAEYQKRAEAAINPGLQFNAHFRRELLDRKDRFNAFIVWAKKQPGYPNNDFGGSIAKFLSEELGIRLAVGGEATQ